MRIHCTALAAVLAACAGVAAAQQAQPAPGDSAFSIYLRSNPIGREQVKVSRTDAGWVIVSTGNIGAPVDVAINRFEMKYSGDWQPLEMKLDARVQNAPIAVATSFGMTSAINEITQNGRTVAKTDQTSARTIVMPNNVFGAYEALAARIFGSAVNAELPVYIAPQGEIKVLVRAVADQMLTGPAGSIPTRRFDLSFQNPSTPVNAVMIVDNQLRLVRLEIPEIGLVVVRDDAASVATRTELARNPTDADVMIPANGFQLAGTTTTPPAVAGRLRFPAVILVGGVLPPGRDETIDGIPIFAQLAGRLADGGHIVLRYDRRGSGQSGGRIDSATLADYADDAVAAVRWMAKQNDVDRRRIVVVGYADGGAVALSAAARERQIDAVATIDASGSLGADLLLLQQQHLLDDLKLSPSDRQARIELQKRIQAAVISGKGWESIPEPLRRQADTPWFRSVLTYDPSTVVPRIRQPILILHADSDPNVPPSEAERLVELARARKKAGPAEIVHVSGVNHTLADQQTRATSPKIVSALVEWIRKL
ncbi:MAG TPA: alpha/beta fold hydrolase [Vicinamibacterales bacterium]|nr:alpha/beta fold hydrolase [Vicinamibacterales bacterium]